MKDILVVIMITLGLIAVWISQEAKIGLDQSYVSKDLLEISQPFNGRIDTEFLNELDESNNLP